MAIAGALMLHKHILFSLQRQNLGLCATYLSCLVGLLSVYEKPFCLKIPLAFSKYSTEKTMNCQPWLFSGNNKVF